VVEHLRVFGHVGFFMSVGGSAASDRRDRPNVSGGSCFKRRERRAMSIELIILIIVLIVLFGGGGGYYWSRGRG
jgi:hypothetical protein